MTGERRRAAGHFVESGVVDDDDAFRRRRLGRGGGHGRRGRRGRRCDAVYNASWDGVSEDDEDDEDRFEEDAAGRETRQSTLGYAGALALNVALGTMFCWSIYLVPLEEVLGVGRAALSTVFSLSTIGTVTAMSFAGPRVYASHSPTKIAVFAGILATAGLWTAALAVPLRSVLPLYLGFGLMFGFASGLGYGLSVQMSPYAPVESGLATGLVTSARAFGAFVFAPLVRQALLEGGAQFALNALGNYIAMATVPIFLLFNGSGLKDPLAKLRSTDTVTLSEMERDYKLTPLTRLLWLCMATGLFSGLMVMSHGATLLSSRGLFPQMLVIGGISIVSAMTTAGRILGGWLCDRTAPKRVLVFTPLLAVGPLVWAAIDKTSGLAGELALAAAALVYGMFASTIPVEVRRVSGAGDFARAYGRVFTAWGLAGLAAPYLTGLIYDSYGDYTFALYVAAALSCVSAFLSTLLESPRAAAREVEAREAQLAATRDERYIDCTIIADADADADVGNDVRNHQG